MIAAALLSTLLAASPPAADVVARVGDRDVTAVEIRDYLSTLPAEAQAAVAKDPALLSQAVRAYLGRLAVLREARARKVDQDPAVKRQLDRLVDEALVELYLDGVSRPPEGFPSEAELEQAWRSNQKALEAPAQFSVAQIFVPSPKGAAPEAEEKARARAEGIARKARQKGADFGALARAESGEKEAAARGGELGWLAEAQLVPGIRATVLKLQKGGVSEPVRLDDGWHVVKLLDARPGGVRPLAEVKDVLRAELRAARAKALRQAAVAKLLGDSPPALNELSLQKVLPPR